MSPIVSVVMAVRNAGAHLGTSVMSVLAQEQADCELLAVDDGSTDDSLKILRRFSERDSRVRVLRKENGGVSSARNMGLDHARGEFITFLDADDRLSPGAFQILREGVALGADISIGDFSSTRVKSRSPRAAGTDARLTVAADAVLDMLYSRYFTSSVWAKLYRRQAVEDVRFDTTLNYAEDLDYNWRVMKNSEYVSFIPRSVYIYNDTGESATRSAPTMRHLDVLRALSVLRGDATTSRERLALSSRAYVEALSLTAAARRLKSDDSVLEKGMEALRDFAPSAASDRDLAAEIRILAHISRMSPRLSVEGYNMLRRVARR